MSGGLTYQVSSGKVVVTARSMVHDTRTVWDRVSGAITVDAKDPGSGATATLEVDMRAFDAGDRLKNWKLKGDLAADRWPTATFRLAGLTIRGASPPRPAMPGEPPPASRSSARLEARAQGQLAWRGREVDVVATGTGTLEPTGLEAEARFELDVRTLGIEPPKILLIKVEPIVSVIVTLSARPAA